MFRAYAQLLRSDRNFCLLWTAQIVSELQSDLRESRFGAGALLGPPVGGRWARHRQERLRAGILAGFLMAGAGYAWLGGAGALWMAVLPVLLAHAGGSCNWVFSTTLLRVHSTDRFRGRVFAADSGLCMLAVSTTWYLASVAIDLGVPVRTSALAVGCAMLVPAAAWAAVLLSGAGSAATPS